MSESEPQADETPAIVEQQGQETGPVTCSCEWRTMDTGNSFYSRIVKADPNCRVHPPGWGWGT